VIRVCVRDHDLSKRGMALGEVPIDVREMIRPADSGIDQRRLLVRSND